MWYCTLLRCACYAWLRTQPNDTYCDTQVCSDSRVRGNQHCTGAGGTKFESQGGLHMRSYCCFTGTVHSTPANRQTPDEIMDAPDPFGACCGRCLHWGAQCLPSVAHQMCWWIRARPLTQSRCLKALFRLVPACYCNSSLCLALLTLHLLSFSWSLVSCVCTAIVPAYPRIAHADSLVLWVQQILAGAATFAEDFPVSRPLECDHAYAHGCGVRLVPLLHHFHVCHVSVRPTSASVLSVRTNGLPV